MLYCVTDEQQLRQIAGFLPGVRRGVAAMLDQSDTILSLFRLGVVGAALAPGNPLIRSSGAEHFKLPDGSWAVAVVHAYPSATTVLGGLTAPGAVGRASRPP